MNKLLVMLCDMAYRHGATFADVRAVESDQTSVFRQDRRAERLSCGTNTGIGVRVIVDNAWGFASVSGLNEAEARCAVESAVAMARASSTRSEEAMVVDLGPVTDIVSAEFAVDPRSVSIERKMKALAGFEAAAVREAGSKLVNLALTYGDIVRKETVCNTFGTNVETESVRTIMHCLVVTKDGSILQKGRARVGAPKGFELVEETSADDFTVKASKLACSLLTAVPAPAGKFPVVFHPSITGLLTHEAIGHNAEADHVLSGGSIIAEKLGQKVASDLVTIIDDSTIPGKWGSFKYDSEGTPSTKRVIIEQGVLKNYMHSLETAARMGARPNGSARAQSYSCRPIVRMSNTFIQPGESTFEEIIRGIDRGIYLLAGEYGYVFCERGQYTCHAGDAYMIRNGQLAEHLRDVSVAGMTLETLLNIDAVANDFEMQMPGMCGKNGQGMQVDNGGPHVRVKELVVGGRE